MSDLIKMTQERAKKEAKVAVIAGGVLGTLNAMSITDNSMAALAGGVATTAAGYYMIEKDYVKTFGSGVENITVGCATFVASSVIGTTLGAAIQGKDNPASAEFWED